MLWESGVAIALSIRDVKMKGRKRPKQNLRKGPSLTVKIKFRRLPYRVEKCMLISFGYVDLMLWGIRSVNTGYYKVVA